MNSLSHLPLNKWRYYKFEKKIKSIYEWNSKIELSNIYHESVPVLRLRFAIVRKRSDIICFASDGECEET